MPVIEEILKQWATLLFYNSVLKYLIPRAQLQFKHVLWNISFLPPGSATTLVT